MKRRTWIVVLALAALGVLWGSLVVWLQQHRRALAFAKADAFWHGADPAGLDSGEVWRTGEPFADQRGIAYLAERLDSGAPASLTAW